jgi:hypothetical protein
MQLWDIVSPANLTVFARTVPDELPDSLARFLPDRIIPGIKSRIAKKTRTNVVAQYRAYNAETPIGSRPVSVAVTEVLLPPVGQKLMLTEWERLQLEAARNGGSSLDEMVATIYDDIENSVRAVRNRAELARGGFLNSGKFSLVAENGLTIEADFVLAGTHKPTAGTIWSNPVALALTDEQAYVKVVKDDSGKAPIAAITSSTIIGYLLKNNEYRSAYWGGNAGSQPNLNRAQLNQVRSDNGLPVLVEYDHQLYVNGANARVIPQGKFILVTDGVGESQWGLTAEGLDFATTGAVDFVLADAPGLVASAWKSPDPVTGWTKTNATFMPVAADINGLLSATVL